MEIKEMIVIALKGSKKGYSIEALSMKCNTSRITISKYLAELRGEQKIKVEHIGNKKIHYWKC